VITTLFLNPSSLPGKIAVEARIWERFRFNKFIVHYEPIVPATQAGTLIAAYDFDPTDADYTPGAASVPLILGNRSAEMFRVNTPNTFRVRLDPSKDRFWVQPEPSTDDYRLMYQGVVTLYNGDQYASTLNLGHISIEYEVTLYNPCLDSTGVTLTPDSKQKFINPVNGYGTYQSVATDLTDDLKTSLGGSGMDKYQDVFGKLISQATASLAGHTRQEFAKLPVDPGDDGQEIWGWIIRPGTTLAGALAFYRYLRFRRPPETSRKKEVRTAAAADPSAAPTSTEAVDLKYWTGESGIQYGGLYLISWYDGEWRVWSLPIHDQTRSLFEPGTTTDDASRYFAPSVPLTFYGVGTGGVNSAVAGYTVYTNSDTNEYTHSQTGGTLTLNVKNSTGHPMYVYMSATPWFPGDASTFDAIYATTRCNFYEGEFCPTIEVVSTGTTLPALLEKSPHVSATVHGEPGPAFVMPGLARRVPG
jgi:hypothetical protein